jgi:arylformamidase
VLNGRSHVERKWGVNFVNCAQLSKFHSYSEGRNERMAEIAAEFVRAKAGMRAHLPCRLAVSYGASEPERLDIFPVATRGPAPIFVFIHGGYWRLLDSADSCFMAECFTQAGACVVAVNYALAPLVTLAEIVRQCRAAVAWVYAHAHEFGGDPKRIHVGGSSAGGHLAAMMLAPGWEADFRTTLLLEQHY